MAGKPIQLLMAGGTYTHAYWDWPHKPATYSYVDNATRHGKVTLNLDRLGYGNSDHPNPIPLDFPTQANVAHQVVQYLRAGAVGTPFHTVVSNGFSMGGLVAEYEAANYHDVDGVILSGIGHDCNAGCISAVATKTMPAKLDPKFATKPWLPGYFTTIPGQRSMLLSANGEAEPEQNIVEERLKGVMTIGEIGTVLQDSFDHSITKKINVPVLWAHGIHDKIWCTTTQNCATDPQTANEWKYYSPSAQLVEYIVPHSGHSINIAYGAQTFYNKINKWIGEHNLG